MPHLQALEEDEFISYSRSGLVRGVLLEFEQ